MKSIIYIYILIFRNIIHRDLKPENILGKNHLDKICLIDFGIAKDLDKITTEK